MKFGDGGLRLAGNELADGLAEVGVTLLFLFRVSVIREVESTAGTNRRLEVC